MNLANVPDEKFIQGDFELVVTNAEVRENNAQTGFNLFLRHSVPSEPEVSGVNTWLGLPADDDPADKQLSKMRRIKKAAIAHGIDLNSLGDISPEELVPHFQGATCYATLKPTEPTQDFPERSNNIQDFLTPRS